MTYHRFHKLALLMVFATAFSSIAPTTAWASPGERPVCPGPAAQGFVRCHAWILRPQATASPTGLSPQVIKSAYGFSTSSTAGAGKTIRTHGVTGGAIDGSKGGRSAPDQ